MNKSFFIIKLLILIILTSILSYAKQNFVPIMSNGITLFISIAPELPIDSNLELGNENDILYYVDPRPEEGGENRALRINKHTMRYSEISVDGDNPHSLDRAGNSDKFYIRTQNSYSFDVVNFKNNTVKTISLDDHKPRAIGAYNAKYNIQLLSALNMPIVDVIDTKNDKILGTVGDRHTYDKAQLHANAGNGSATGHAIWLTTDYFVLIDRVHAILKLFHVDSKRNYTNVDTISLPTAVHAIEKIKNPQGSEALTFYAIGEGDIDRNIYPFVAKLILDEKRGKLSPSIRYLRQSKQTIKNVKPTTHHAGITPDKRYLIVPVYDGKIYIINKHTLRIVKVINTNHLGAGHIEFSESRNLAIITNHFSRYITILNLNSLAIKKYIKISHHTFDPKTKHLLQPHFSNVSDDGKYYYTFATQDGDFLKIDLDTLEIVETLHTGGTPEQAHS